MALSAVVRHAWWFPIFICLLLESASLRGADAAPQPNIVVVLADQWRAQAFGFAGDPNVRTPNFDRLAGESVRFVNAVAGLPVMFADARLAAHGPAPADPRRFSK